MAPSERTLTCGVVVVDDQVIFRQAAREVLAATPGFELLGEASSGEHALSVIEELEPDLALVDVRMPGIDGIETATRIRDRYPQVVVVLISVDEAAHLPGNVGKCGAVDLLRKQDFRPSVLSQVWDRHGPAPE